MSYLGLEGKTYLVFGVANRKSVAFFTGRALEEQGAKVVYAVHSESRREQVAKLLDGKPVHVCDVEKAGDLDRLAAELNKVGPLAGIVHSIAYANYSAGLRPFHETRRDDYLQATLISAFSLVEMAAAFKDLLESDASVVAISISSTTITVENYGYMSPVKSALDGIVRNLAKSFSRDTRVRFNAVGAGPLKTSSSAGIPGYMDNYLYAEKMTFRKKALETAEVADTVLFLLSPRSSGINGTVVTVDAGLGLNTFDQDIVARAMRPGGS